MMARCSGVGQCSGKSQVHVRLSARLNAAMIPPSRRASGFANVAGFTAPAEEGADRSACSGRDIVQGCDSWSRLHSGLSTGHHRSVWLGTKNAHHRCIGFAHSKKSPRSKKIGGRKIAWNPIVVNLGDS
jgi:hypothetical protein